MKRSNRLIMLVGVFLAVLAFVGVLVLSQGGNRGGEQTEVPTTQNVVVAAVDIPLGTVIDESMVTLKAVDLAGVTPGAFVETSQVIGQVARQEALTGAQITLTTIGAAGGGGLVEVRVPPGMRAMTVQVDPATRLGEVIKQGDFVDMVIRIKIPPSPGAAIDSHWDTSSKLLLQGMQVLATDARAAVTPAEGETPAEPGTQVTAGNLVTLALTPAQVEVVKWVQNVEVAPGWAATEPSISLVLRSPTDFVDENGNPRLPESPCVTAPLPTTSPSPDASPEPPVYRGCETTSGIVLSNLIQEYGVLHPALDAGEYIIDIGPDLIELITQLAELQAAAEQQQQ